MHAGDLARGDPRDAGSERRLVALAAALARSTVSRETLLERGRPALDDR
jgi:hypothetical protein